MFLLCKGNVQGVDCENWPRSGYRPQPNTFKPNNYSDTKTEMKKETVFEGILKKYSNPINGWKDRLFEITRTFDPSDNSRYLLMMEYYDKNAKKSSYTTNNPRGSIIIDKETLITQVYQNAYSFEITSRNTLFYLQAPDKTSKNAWIMILKTLINQPEVTFENNEVLKRFKNLQEESFESIYSEITRLEAYQKTYVKYLKDNIKYIIDQNDVYINDSINILEMSGSEIVIQMEKTVDHLKKTCESLYDMSKSMSFDFEEKMKENNVSEKNEYPLYFQGVNKDSTNENLMVINKNKKPALNAKSFTNSSELNNDDDTTLSLESRMNNIRVRSEDYFASPEFWQSKISQIESFSHAYYCEENERPLVEEEMVKNHDKSNKQSSIQHFGSDNQCQQEEEKKFLKKIILEKHQKGFTKYFKFITEGEKLYKLIKSQGIFRIYCPRSNSIIGSRFKLIFDIKLPGLTSYECVHALNSITSRLVYGKHFDQNLKLLKNYDMNTNISYVMTRKLPLISQRYSVYISDYRKANGLAGFDLVKEDSAEKNNTTWSSVHFDTEDHLIKEFLPNIKDLNGKQKPIQAFTDNFTIFKTFHDQKLCQELISIMYKDNYEKYNYHDDRKSIVTDWFMDVEIDCGGSLPKLAINYSIQYHIPKFYRSFICYIFDRYSKSAPDFGPNNSSEIFE